MRCSAVSSHRVSAWFVCLVLAVSLAGCGASASLPAAIPPATLAAYQGNGDPALLVDARWLQAQLSANPAGLVILDASELATYRAGHISGAVHAWWQDTMDPNGPVYGTVLKPDPNQPDPQELRRQFVEDLGVDGNVRVVVYDNQRGTRAARIVWTLRFLGYPNTSVLDGGLGAWRGAGGAVETKTRDPRRVARPEIVPQGPQESWYLVESQLAARLADPGYLIVDFRSDRELHDDVGGTIGLGTVPGTLRLDWTTLVDGDGRLLPPEAILAAAQAAGLTPDRTIVVFGLYGTDTGLPWLALRLAGFPLVTISDGGWNEWARNPNSAKTSLS